MQQVHLNLPILYPLQEEIANDKTRHRVISAGRRVGKTILLNDITINDMIDGKRVIYLTPTYKRADDAFDSILKILPPSIVKSSNKTNRKIELIDLFKGSWVQFFSYEAVESVRGFECETLVIDEASLMPNLLSVRKAILLPLLLSTNGRSITASTPRGLNDFYALYQKGVNGDKGYKSWTFSSFENPHLPREYLDDMIAEMTEEIYNQEILALPSANAGAVVGVLHILNGVIKELSKEPTIVYGIDLAKYNDYTVIIGLDEAGRMTYFDRFNQTPWQVTQDRIAALPNDILKVVDSTGLGDVILEALQLRCANMRGFQFNAQTKPPLMYAMFKNIELGILKYNEITGNELQTLEYKITKTGHVQFAAKAGFNDDCVMALAIADKYRLEAIRASQWSLMSLDDDD